MSDNLPLTFDPAFGKLGRDIARFANHTRKYVIASRKHRAVLERASAWTDGAAPLDTTPESPAAAMKAIDKFARIHREDRHKAFGAYFAHHHLRMQAELSRTLLRASFGTNLSGRSEVCHDVLRRSVESRRQWVAALLERSIAAAAPDLSPDQYVALNVGALSDHEDVDLAIVVSSVEAREHFAKGFAKLSKTFLKYASKIQLFLAEQLEDPTAGGLVEEYEGVVVDDCSVVVVMQLLGAQFLSGSRVLARALEERVTDRYYAESGDPLAHEALLRAIMGELRHYHSLDRASEILSPKRDIYIPSKLVTTAMRVIHGVRQPRASLALLELAEKSESRTRTYTGLADAFVQNEILRALLFLYVVKTDDIDLFEPTMVGACRRVAMLLGLGRSTKRSPEARLLAHYRELRSSAMSRVFELSFDIGRHLRRVSTFRKLIERGPDLTETNVNVVLRLMDAVRRYERGVFWDEVLDLLQGLSGRFLVDLDRLEPNERVNIAREFLSLMCADTKSLVEFLIYVASLDAADPQSNGAHAALFWEAMLWVLESDPHLRESFISRLDDETETEALFRLARSYDPARLARLANFLEDADRGTRGERVVRALRSMIILVHHHANKTGRLANRVLGRAPDFVHRVGDNGRLRALARELTAQAAREPIPREQIGLLGDSFDVDVLSASLFAILNGVPADRDAAYVEAFHLYARELFKACFRAVQHRSPLFQHMRPGAGIAIFSTGSFGRGEGFGGDWDYIVVLQNADRTSRKFFSKVIQRMTAAIARRGIIPHNRFTDRFESYVIVIDELKEHLRTRTDDTFIDEAEVIEARFVLGDRMLKQRFIDEVQPIVVDQNRRQFLTDILRELRDRRDSPPEGLNVKQGAGGLREIHLLWLAIRAFARLTTAFAPDQYATVAELMPSQRADLRFLLIANAELRRIRDLHRLVVDQNETLDPAVLVRIAHDLRPLQEAGAHDDFEREIETLMKATAIRIDRIANYILSHIEAEAADSSA